MSRDLRAIYAAVTQVGFINPVLYKSSGGVGFDVVEGNNKAQFCPAGFNAAKGWDAVSGLGERATTALPFL